MTAPDGRTWARSPAARITLLVVIVVALAVAAQLSGLAALVTRERVESIARSSGVLGFLAYLVLASLGEIAQLPGVIFVVAAVAAYGPWLGTLAAYAGMLGACCSVFLFGRLVGGRALTEIDNPRVVALMARIERHPIRSVAFARAALFMLPGVGYALALSPVRFWQYAVGSAIGLWVPIVLGALLAEGLLTWVLP